MKVPPGDASYRGACDRCSRSLAGDDAAFVCSYACTFCASCTRTLAWKCPNCGGELARRPRRNPSTATIPRSGSRRPSSVRITRLGPGDVGAAARLFDGYRQFYGAASDLPGVRAFLSNRLERDESVLFGAWSGSKLVGFAQLYPTWSSTRMDRLWILNDLFVEPRLRRRGVASRLMARSEEWIRRSGGLGGWLETAVDNPAQILYAGRGWKLDQEFLHFDWEPGVAPERKRPGGVRRGRRSG
jgi:GNAT superfamily N-acetyltransferase